MKIGKRAVTLVIAALSGATLLAVPVATLSPKETRQKLVAEAESYSGVPYRYGGVDRSGLDCSGLVYLTVLGATGKNAPRTSRAQYGWVDPVSRSQLQRGDLVFFDTTGRLSHVGVYLGDGTFIHSASDGPRTGVIVSSLSEPYWDRSFVGGGRIVQPVDYLGLRLSLGGGVTGWPGPEETSFRGASLQGVISFDILGFHPGVELRPEWDKTLGVIRVSPVLSLGLGDNWRVFLGPALVAGDPVLETGGRRAYAPGGGWLATGGICWTPFGFNLQGARVSPYLDLAWQRYVPDSSEPQNNAADLVANFRASFGLQFSWDY